MRWLQGSTPDGTLFCSFNGSLTVRLYRSWQDEKALCTVVRIRSHVYGYRAKKCLASVRSGTIQHGVHDQTVCIDPAQQYVYMSNAYTSQMRPHEGMCPWGVCAWGNCAMRVCADCAYEQFVSWLLGLGVAVWHSECKHQTRHNRDALKSKSAWKAPSFSVT